MHVTLKSFQIKPFDSWSPSIIIIVQDLADSSSKSTAAVAVAESELPTDVDNDDRTWFSQKKFIVLKLISRSNKSWSPLKVK